MVSIFLFFLFYVHSCWAMQYDNSSLVNQSTWRFERVLGSLSVTNQEMFARQNELELSLYAVQALHCFVGNAMVQEAKKKLLFIPMDLELLRLATVRTELEKTINNYVTKIEQDSGIAVCDQSLQTDKLLLLDALDLHIKQLDKKILAHKYTYMGARWLQLMCELEGIERYLLGGVVACDQRAFRRCFSMIHWIKEYHALFLKQKAFYFLLNSVT